MFVKPHSITHVAAPLPSQAGDVVVNIRVVPAGREGKKILGRSLRPGEEDTGERITFLPSEGENVHFPFGSIEVGLEDVDRASEPGADGYAPLAGTLWAWLKFGAPQDEGLFRYLFAAARRLDQAHALCSDALGRAELMCMALGRGLDMIQALPGKFGVQRAIPDVVGEITPALAEIRHAFEQIDDRAVGNVRGKLDAQALSIFEQPRLVPDGILAHGSYALDLGAEVLPALVESRRFVMEVASAIAGPARSLDTPVDFAQPTPERIRERAYYLWERREGSAWWDADANWLEAERSVSRI
jgi:hypothetical protein